MLQTNAPDLMDLFARLFDTPHHAGSDQANGDSTLVPPMAELAAPPVPLSALLGEDNTILARFLDVYADQNAPALAKEFAEVSLLVRENKPNYFLGGKPAGRLQEFVYPVV
ncbi:hypothetical protein [Phaeobacter sp. J2-8]|uniref:hypothetical protein n=1 Tax=Phaeobacter sp. J2-8 TaxID=2931394 RepID=UPI001FD02B82|nr:hypothetical protein [Phaeobacter sp. J2-8]MCJ7874847.1 hypothetical protein [Phaeobacter sp. J2-8]